MKHLQNAMNQQLQLHEHTFIQLAAKLNALSPLATLHRGFAIPTKENKTIVRSVNQVKSGEKIQVRLADGELKCIVAKVSS